MDTKLLSPLEFYHDGGKDRHGQYAEELFERHLEDAGLDPEENQQLAAAYDASAAEYESLKNSRAYCVLFGVLAMVLLAAGIGLVLSYEEGIAYPVIGGCLIVPVCVGLFGKVIPDFRSLNQKVSEKREESEKLLLPPKEQLKILDGFFDPWEGLALVEKTVPDLRFHDFFSREHQARLEYYDFREPVDRWSSVTKTLAGDFRGNPFLFFTVLRRTMRDHKYTGSKTIYWQEEERQYVRKERTYTDRDGNLQTESYYEWEYVTVQKEETLEASVTAPVPSFSKDSALGYGHHTAPDLTFSRKPKHVQKKSEDSIRARVEWRSHSLRSKSERAVRKGQEFTMMANEEFEVLFGASDRDNEHQFRVLFTPQAQTNMVALLKDSTLIGDEFSFRKCRKYNLIPCDEKVFQASPTHYHDYSVQEARKNYLSHQQEYFRAMFGVFSPLLAIPGYQERPLQLPLGGAELTGHFAVYEHEAVANQFLPALLVTDDCETQAILKTRLLRSTQKADIVEVTSHGYTTRDRVETFSIWGGDGRYHDVDVDWVEYIPRTKTTTISIEALSEENRSEFGQPGSVFCRGLAAKIIESN